MILLWLLHLTFGFEPRREWDPNVRCATRARLCGWRHTEVVEPRGVPLPWVVAVVGRELAVSNLQRRQLFCSNRTLPPRRMRLNLAVFVRRVRVMIMLRRGRS